jgi:ribosomal-protein-alanine N-acetyltransferase
MEPAALRLPSDAELDEIATLATRGAAFDDREEFIGFAAAGPWRVLVTDAGDAVVLERWREHLDWLAMRAVWAAPRRMPGIVEAVRDVARERGLGTVLSPFVASELAGPYERAGMAPALKVLVLRRPVSAQDETSAPAQPWRFHPAGPGDAEALLALDHASFDPVWAYDRTILERFVDRGRVLLASRGPGGPALGYVAFSFAEGEGMIGRLAVDPAARGEGIGSALVERALRGIGLAGGSYATLTTQADNVAAQSLYAGLGFKTLRGHLVGLTASA